MKGPLAFLVSLAAVAAIGVTVVLPALQEKQRLLAEGSEAAKPAASPNVPKDRLKGTLTALREALGADPDGWPDSPADRGVALAGELRATVEKNEGSTVVLLMGWNLLPRLLTALTEPAAPTLESLSAAPAEDADKCRVSVRFSVLSDTREGR